MNAINSKTFEKATPSTATLTCRIVVPCYNEEKRLNSEAFLRFADENQDIGFVFVDDGSRDKTFAKLIRLRSQNPRQMEVLQLQKNSGKAEAVRVGLLFAAQLESPMVGYWDADLATPLAAIGDFLRVTDRFSDVDIVFGSRKQLLGHRIHRKFSRLLISRTCAALARLAISLPVSDTQCGAKLLRNTKQLQQSLGTAFTTGWLFDVELFSRLARNTKTARKAFFEFPLLEWEEIAGSKVTVKAILRAGFSMLGLIVRTRMMPEGVRRLSAMPDRIVASATVSQIDSRSNINQLHVRRAA